MEDSTAKKSASFETLVIQNITNINDLKAKLNDIILSGPKYEYDVSSCLKCLIKGHDEEIAFLTVQAISELAKCEDKRSMYANEDIVLPIMQILEKDFASDRYELIKQCLRAIGNLCCDNDISRKLVLDNNGVKTLKGVLDKALLNKQCQVFELTQCTLKLLLNFVIGGEEFSEAIIEAGVPEVIQKILENEVKSLDVNDDIAVNALLILSVVNDNQPQHVYDDKVNEIVLKMLAVTANIEISEICLELLHAQAENDSVKTLLAKCHGVQLVCSRLQDLVECHAAGDLKADDEKVDDVMKRACDLAIIILTGDEAMNYLYNHGKGDAYQTVVRWMKSSNHHLITTAVLAIGNFARREDYCRQMMDEGIFEKLLDLFENYYNLEVRMLEKPEDKYPMDIACVMRIQHASLSAVRNILVPAANKKKAAEEGRAIELFLRAIPRCEDAHVAFKLLAATRMLVDGQESMARAVLNNPAALAGIARHAARGDLAAAAGEAPRLLAWCARAASGGRAGRAGRASEASGGCAPATLLHTSGCVASLVNMVMAVHPLMQNEAILALTLLAVHVCTDNHTPSDLEVRYIDQLVQADIGKHLSVLIETNCGKMPAEVAENMAAFLDITAKKNKIASDYKEAKIHESLQKFLDSRSELKDELKAVIRRVIAVISDNGK